MLCKLKYSNFYLISLCTTFILKVVIINENIKKWYASPNFIHRCNIIWGNVLLFLLNILLPFSDVWISEWSVSRFLLKQSRSMRWCFLIETRHVRFPCLFPHLHVSHTKHVYINQSVIIIIIIITNNNKNKW